MGGPGSGRRSSGNSLGEQAARICVAEHISYQEAGRRFGISRQAVEQAYRKLFPDADPPVGYGNPDLAARAVAIQLIRAGRSDAEVAAEVGFSVEYVGKIRRSVGIDRMKEKSAAFDRAVDAVCAGARAVDAAIDNGVSYNHLAERCRELNIPLNGSQGHRTGAVVAAVELVEREGITPTEAAKRTRCTTPGIYRMLRQRQER